MAELIIPDEAMLREPNLLIPGNKPIGPVKIDWTHSLSIGVKAAFVPDQSGFMDLYDHSRADVKDESIPRIDSGNIAAEFVAASSTGVVFNRRPRYGIGQNNGGSIFAILTPDAFVNYSAIIANQETTTTNGFELRLGLGSSSSEITFNIMSASSGYRGYRHDSSIVTTGERTVLCVTFDKTIKTSPKYYLNGVEISAINYGGSGTGTISAPSTKDLYIGPRYDNVTKYDGSIEAIYLFDRKLTNNEQLLLYKDPYQFLIPA